jgi:hypothetical protein
LVNKVGSVALFTWLQPRTKKDLVPRKGLPMKEISEVRGLKTAGLSVREIVRSTGAART